MMSTKIVLFTLLLGGCFSDAPGVTDSGDEESSSSSSSGESGSGEDESSGPGSSSGSGPSASSSESDSSGIEEDSSGTTADTDDGLILWHAWDGDYLDAISGQEGIPTGDASVNTSALELHGSGTVDVSYFNADYRATLQSMTISIRYFANSGAGQRTLFALGDNGEAITNNTHQVRIVNNVFELMTETGEGENHVVQLGPAPDFTAAAWHTVTFAFDGAVVTTCSDGAWLSEADYVPAQTQAEKLFVGGTWITGEGWDGLIDDMRIWNVPLPECK